MDYRYFGYAIFIFLRVTIATKKSISEAKVNLFFTFKEEYTHTPSLRIQHRKYCNNFLLKCDIHTQ